MYTKVYRCVYNMVISNATFLSIIALKTDILFHSVLKINRYEVLDATNQPQLRLSTYSTSLSTNLQDNAGSCLQYTRLTSLK